MQSYQDQELIQTSRGTVAELTEAMPSNATHHVIGLQLVTGGEVTINGLVWIVERVNVQKGWMRLRLKMPDA